MGSYQSGQMGQTVNLLALAFGGSNPSLPTKFFFFFKTDGKVHHYPHFHFHHYPHSFGALNIFRGTIVRGNINLYTVIIAWAFTIGKRKSWPGLCSPRSNGSKTMGEYCEQARRLPHSFRPTPSVSSLSMTKIAIA